MAQQAHSHAEATLTLEKVSLHVLVSQLAGDRPPLVLCLLHAQSASTHQVRLVFHVQVVKSPLPVEVLP